ncbi:hypothetical protein [Streptomyces sp. NPDC056431]|uniref:aspartate-alanine antiporter-like transporter n=1 Tax=Streptomyces sp. NPDC056431 TaxID=3345814 RepID=UPI0036B8583E
MQEAIGYGRVSRIWQFFAVYPWFTLFIVIAAGSLLGMVRFGPVTLGPAGVLFAGLLLGSLDGLASCGRRRRPRRRGR